jgi:hypothetical protein
MESENHLLSDTLPSGYHSIEPIILSSRDIADDNSNLTIHVHHLHLFMLTLPLTTFVITTLCHENYFLSGLNRSAY